MEPVRGSLRTRLFAAIVLVVLLLRRVTLALGALLTRQQVREGDARRRSSTRPTCSPQRGARGAPRTCCTSRRSRPFPRAPERAPRVPAAAGARSGRAARRGPTAATLLRRAPRRQPHPRAGAPEHVRLDARSDRPPRRSGRRASPLRPRSPSAGAPVARRSGRLAREREASPAASRRRPSAEGGGELGALSRRSTTWRSSSRAPARRAPVPALGQPRAEDPADGDPRVQRGARRGRGRPRRGDDEIAARVRPARPARARPARPRADEPQRVRGARAEPSTWPSRPATRCAGSSRKRGSSASRSSPTRRLRRLRSPTPTGCCRPLEPRRERAAPDARGRLRHRRARPGELAVEDTGPGLEPEELPRAFERFYLYSRYRGDRAVGTGLGLAIVKELADAMGGRVEVASEPGRGTRFTLRLRPAPARPRELAPAY